MDAFEVILLITAVLAMFAYTMPGLVIVGFILMVVPGLILSLAPTAFCYLALAWVIRFLLPWDDGVLETALSLAASGAIGWALLQPSHRRERARFEAAIKPSTAAPEGFHLHGHVRLEGFKAPFPARYGHEGCNAMGLLVLDQPGVEAVTLANEKEARTFRLGPDHPGVRVQPLKASDILRHFPWGKRREGLKKGWDDLKQRQQALDSDWAMRTSGEEPLMMAPAKPGESPDFTIRRTQTDRRSEDPRVDYIEILDREGQIIAREGVTEYWIPAPYFFIEFISGSAGSGFSGRGWRMARQVLRERGRLDTFEPTKTTIELARLAEPEVGERVTGNLRESVVAALANADATKAQLALGDLWLAANSHGLSADDMPIAGAILEDTRFPVSHDRLTGALHGKSDLTPLRRGLVQRVSVPSASNEKEYKEGKGILVGLLLKMPPGTFAQPTPSERILWESVYQRPVLAPFLKRMADQGEAAVPDMLAMIDNLLSAPAKKRYYIYEVLVLAFQELGPKAKAAIPRINSLSGMSGSPLTKKWKQRGQWCFALARMGLPIEDIAFPRDFGEDTINRYREAARERLARFEEKQAKEAEAT